MSIHSGRSEPVCGGMQYQHWFILVGAIPPKLLYYCDVLPVNTLNNLWVADCVSIY
jgi:hypothetical protein